MKNVDSKSHVRGESIYVDDIPLVQGTLYACVFDSPVAHGKLKSLDTTIAETSEGVFKIWHISDPKPRKVIPHKFLGDQGLLFSPREDILAATYWAKNGLCSGTCVMARFAAN